MSTLPAHVQYWSQSADRSWQTAKDLYKTKHFDACLFFCHLAIEKFLKALVVQKTHTAAPFTHDLVLLAQRAGLPLSTAQKELCRTINTFNISGRYDDYKFQFYKKATAPYTRRFLKETEALYIWLQQNQS